MKKTFDGSEKKPNENISKIGIKNHHLMGEIIPVREKILRENQEHKKKEILTHLVFTQARVLAPILFLINCKR